MRLLAGQPADPSVDGSETAAAETSASVGNEHVDILTVGNGMVGHRFIEILIERNVLTARSLVVGEERRSTYVRVHLSSVFDGVEESDLQLGDDDVYSTPRLELLLGDPVVSIDRVAMVARTAPGVRSASPTP